MKRKRNNEVQYENVRKKKDMGGPIETPPIGEVEDVMRLMSLDTDYSSQNAKHYVHLSSELC